MMARRVLYRQSDWKRQKGTKEEKGKRPYRPEWRRDYARVVHSTAFRRLQGKTQLFYGNESVFRNRLTHSIEVAQIAKSLSAKLAHDSGLPINGDIAEIAGLIHDLGHPPFGHNGEKALDDCMKEYGGFEGNAQTLSAVSRIEKRHKAEGTSSYGFDIESGEDKRLGLHLTYRVLASALKYDREIPFRRQPHDPVVKGYYHSARDLIQEIKRNVLGPKWKGHSGPFKTVECSIMDVADDIAYSTYDLEDAWKSGFLLPLDLLMTDKERLEKITRRVRKEPRLAQVGKYQVLDSLSRLVSEPLRSRAEMVKALQDLVDDPEMALLGGAIINDGADQLARSGYTRTAFTSNLVERFMDGVELVKNDRFPSMSQAKFADDTLLMVESLKQYTYISVIDSPRLRIPEYRGYDVVKRMFVAISNESSGGYNLLPEDFRECYLGIPQKDVEQRQRLVCDFIAGMTDSYAVNFHNRLTSDYPTTIFGPVI
jgi:dGTPase